jgi:hypothetical protein
MICGGPVSDTEALISAPQLAATNKANFPNESAEYRMARNALLIEEIELRRHLERVASQRRSLPQGGDIPKDFELVSENGPVRFSSLFGDKATLMVYSLMYGPQRKIPCPMCTSFLTAGTASRPTCVSASLWPSLHAHPSRDLSSTRKSAASRISPFFPTRPGIILAAMSTLRTPMSRASASSAAATEPSATSTAAR